MVARRRAGAVGARRRTTPAPTAQRRTRRGFFARVRVEDYGAGPDPPARAHPPGPKEDRLRLTRATRANLSPIFSLYSDPDGAAWGALAPVTEATRGARRPTTTAPSTGCGGSPTRRAIEAVQCRRSRDAELLIADGHHRYETARVYAEEVGGEGAHRYVLMCLVALEDPGLTVFPTHRLIRGLRPRAAARPRRRAAAGLRRRAARGSGRARRRSRARRSSIGYIDAHFQRPFMLTLKDQTIADAALPGHSEPYRRLDTAVLEALVLKGTLRMSDDDIDHLNGLGYARDDAQALERVQSGEFDAAFFMAPTPIEHVQEVAESGESMPPKSTYFFPKVPTGLLFNPLAD